MAGLVNSEQLFNALSTLNRKEKDQKRVNTRNVRVLALHKLQRSQGI